MLHSGVCCRLQAVAVSGFEGSSWWGSAGCDVLEHCRQVVLPECHGVRCEAQSFGYHEAVCSMRQFIES